MNLRRSILVNDSSDRRRAVAKKQKNLFPVKFRIPSVLEILIQDSIR